MKKKFLLNLILELFDDLATAIVPALVTILIIVFSINLGKWAALPLVIIIIVNAYLRRFRKPKKFYFVALCDCNDGNRSCSATLEMPELDLNIARNYFIETYKASECIITFYKEQK